MLVVAGLGMAAGAMAYRAHRESIARQADLDARRQAVIEAVRRREEKPPAPPPPVTRSPPRLLPSSRSD
jgi:hypothetical protein